MQAYLCGSTSAREEAAIIIAVDGQVQDVWVIIEHGLRAIAMMHILVRINHKRLDNGSVSIDFV